jgi:TRAP transporter TAXI family solute receptor
MSFSLKSLFGSSGESSGMLSRPGFEPTSRAPIRRSLMHLIVAGVLAAMFVGAGVVYMLRPATLRIAVGPAGSDDAKVVQTIAQILGRERGNVRLRVIPTEGATQSANAIDNGTADLAVVRGDLSLPKSARAVATLRKNVVVLWALPPRAAPKGVAAKGTAAKKGPSTVAIKTVADLAGKRIGIIGKTPANIAVLNIILSQYGVASEKVEIVQFGVTEAAEAARSDRVDAILTVGPPNSRITADAVAASSKIGAVRFIEINAADTIVQRHGQYESVEIPAGTFGTGKPDEPIKTIGFNHHIVARAAVSEVTISAFTKQLFSIRQAVISELPHAASIETPDTDKDAVIPAHPGAAAYVDGEERTFLDRYSDMIWWGLMALSALGSLGAWLASYLRRDERHQYLGLRDRLLEMLSEARLAETLAQLDLMQAEADQILRNTLQAFDHGAIDEGGLSASDIVLQQFHAAVADRRMHLVAAPPRGPRAAVTQLASIPAQN